MPIDTATARERRDDAHDAATMGGILFDRWSHRLMVNSR